MNSPSFFATRGKPEGKQRQSVDALTIWTSLWNVSENGNHEDDEDGNDKDNDNDNDNNNDNDNKKDNDNYNDNNNKNDNDNQRVTWTAFTILAMF